MEFDTKIVCPVCECENTHIKNVTFKNGEEYKNWVGKGSAVIIKMFCEEEHNFNIVVGENKGISYIFAEEIRNIKRTLPFCATEE